MIRRHVALAFVIQFLATSAMAQNQGSLRGYVKDEQGGALPGVTVTATSEALIQPSTAITEADGAYRLINLPLDAFFHLMDTVLIEQTSLRETLRERDDRIGGTPLLHFLCIPIAVRIYH